MEQVNRPPGTQLAPSAVNQFIENQRHELEIRADELRLRAQEGERAFAHAGKSLESDERDRRDERQSRLRAAKHRYWFVGVLTLLSLTFVLILAYMGKDQLAAEIVKMAVSLAMGAVGGFFYGRNKAAAQPFDQGDSHALTDSDLS